MNPKPNNVTSNDNIKKTEQGSVIEWALGGPRRPLRSGNLR